MGRGNGMSGGIDNTAFLALDCRCTTILPFPPAKLCSGVACTNPSIHACAVFLAMKTSAEWSRSGVEPISARGGLSSAVKRVVFRYGTLHIARRLGASLFRRPECHNNIPMPCIMDIISLCRQCITHPKLGKTGLNYRKSVQKMKNRTTTVDSFSSRAVCCCC